MWREQFHKFAHIAASDIYVFSSHIKPIEVCAFFCFFDIAFFFWTRFSIISCSLSPFSFCFFRKFNLCFFSLSVLNLQLLRLSMFFLYRVYIAMQLIRRPLSLC